jgi:hypothetical protein
MIPDFEALVAKGYEFLSVGGMYLKPEKKSVKSENGSVSQAKSRELMSEKA